VDKQWRLSPDFPTEMGETDELCNVIHVDARDSFHIFYNTTWRNAIVRCRVLDEDGLPVNDVCFSLGLRMVHGPVPCCFSLAFSLLRGSSPCCFSSALQEIHVSKHLLRVVLVPIVSPTALDMSIYVVLIVLP
jgi:hypothetical protein